MKPLKGQSTLGSEGAIRFSWIELRQIKQAVPELVSVMRRFVASVNALDSKEIPPLFKRAFLEHYGLQNGLRPHSIVETAAKIGMLPRFTKEFVSAVWDGLKQKGVPLDVDALGRIQLMLVLSRDVMRASFSVAPRATDRPLKPSDAEAIEKLLSGLPSHYRLEGEPDACPVSVQLLLKAACDVTGERLDRILSKERPEALSNIRFALMHILRTNFEMSYGRVSALLRREDHGASIHGCKKAVILLEQSRAFRELVEKMKARHAELSKNP
ncbi:MAG: hypothetical protein HZA81_03935 [Candidatus Taylorbacteria bacterium]|nr:hypothetical protein [Candidatus Taylorbacteria bacterium]